MGRIKRIIGFAVCVAVTIGMCGCDNNVDIAYESDKKHISCAWWGNDTRNNYTIDGIDIFRRLNPDISVDCKFGIWGSYTKRQNIYMKSHDEPDVMLINYNWIHEYSPDGTGFYNLYELSDYIDLSNFSQEVLSYGVSNGKLNALPIALNAQVLYYNQDIFDKYGLELPKTWDDFFKVAEVLRKDNIYVLTMNSKSLLFFLGSYFEQTTGRKVCDDEGNFILDKQDIEYILEFYKKLNNEKVFMPIGDSNSKSFFFQKAAGVMRWSSGATDYFSSSIDEGINVVIGDYPLIEGTENLGWYIKPSTMYAISKETSAPEQSARLLDFLINSKEMAELQGTEKGIPLSKTAYSMLDEETSTSIDVKANSKVIENQKYMSVMPFVMENDDIYSGFKSISDYYLYDKDSLENVATEVYNLFYNSQS